VQTYEYPSPQEVRGPESPPPAVTTAARERPTIVGLVLALAVLAIGLLGIVDLAGADVVASAYVAVPLAVVGLGLVARAWYGHGWSLAVIGGLLVLALIIMTAAEGVDASRKSTTWRPVSIDQLTGSYAINVGNAYLDLSAVDFAGQSRTVTVSVDAGNLTIVVPSRVDVQAEVQVNVGNATVFGERWSGIGQGRHAVTDQGADGPGGGELTIQATVNVGNAEVRR
jgi:Cell wall-active antibiotics response LiaF, C-terminal